jgi:hypothetical protein
MLRVFDYFCFIVLASSFMLGFLSFNSSTYDLTLPITCFAEASFYVFAGTSSLVLFFYAAESAFFSGVLFYPSLLSYWYSKNLS